MKPPDQIRTQLTERILRAIAKETDGCLDASSSTYEAVDELVDLVIEELFGEEEYEEGLEELCPDMDLFVDEEE